MRILLFLHGLGIGGAQRQFLQTARGLIDRGHEVALVTLLPGGDLTREVDERVERFVLFPTVSRLGLRILDAPRRLRERIADLHPEVVYSALYINNAIAHRALLGSDLPLVWGLRNAQQKLGWKQELALRYGRRNAPEVDLTISNSHAGHEIHERLGFRFRRHEVVPNGIDGERFRPDPAASAALRKQWRVPENTFLIGFVGRLTPNKDVPGFLRAAAAFSSEARRTRFVAVGDGDPPFVSRLHALARQLGLEEKLTWAGAHSDIAAVQGALDLFTSSSTVEGFPNVVGEAMACETPCVVTDVGDSARIVGEVGLVVPPHDPSALVEAWRRLYSASPQERRRYATGGRDRVIARFGLEACTARTEALLREVLEFRGLSRDSTAGRARRSR
jgi:glycosyltransferase involved in cell wall biosynthesis